MTCGLSSRRSVILIVFLLQTFGTDWVWAQASDPKIVEAAKKTGGEIEAYVTLRTDTAQQIWKKSQWGRP